MPKDIGHEFWTLPPPGLMQAYCDHLFLPALRIGANVEIRFHRLPFLDPRSDCEVWRHDG